MWLIVVVVSLAIGAVLGVALLGVSLLLSPQVPFAQWLSSLFVNFGVSLNLSYEQFLVMAIGACVLLAALVIAVCLLAISVMSSAVGMARMKEIAHRTAMERAGRDQKIEAQREHERLVGLSGILTQRLDKSSLIQNILHATQQLTSLARIDSTVALWVLDFETERMRFARGSRCDESFFTKSDFAMAEAPMAKLASGLKAMVFPKWQDGFPFVKPDKASLLGDANALILAPLIIERTVLGCLAVFCHPEVVKGYNAEQTLYNAAWGQLSLALGIGIQEELAILDRLTGVVNHAYFVKRLAQEIDRSTRYQVPVGVLMTDIDNFKAVNDTLGHPQGDAVLKIVARLLKRSVRAIDLVGRYGGEEFIVLLPETGLTQQASGVPGVVVVAERIRAAVEEEFCRFQKPLSVTVSVGIAVRRFPEDRHMDAREMIRVADEQLYKAKTSGKNKYCLALPEGQPAAAEPSAPVGEPPSRHRPPDARV